MLASYPTFLVGDFWLANSVLNPMWDVRGPGHGRLYRGATALRDLTEQFHLQDAWGQTHGVRVCSYMVAWRVGQSAG